MGTNYYTKKSFLSKEKNIHIGKSSYGWDFYFCGHKEKDLISWNKWKKYLKNQNIIDECGDSISYEDFVKMIETYKAPKFKREDGHVNLNHNEECIKSNDFNSEYDWNDELGYSFGTREFS